MKHHPAWNFFILFVFLSFSIFPLKISAVFKGLELPHIVTDVTEDLAQRFSIIVMFNGAIRYRETWIKNFEGLNQVDKILRFKDSQILFNYIPHNLKIVIYYTVSVWVSVLLSILRHLFFAICKYSTKCYYFLYLLLSFSSSIWWELLGIGTAAWMWKYQKYFPKILILKQKFFFLWDNWHFSKL